MIRTFSPSHLLTFSLCVLAPAISGATWDRTCQTGPGVPIRDDCKDCRRCLWQDLDHDGDCDQSDYGLFQRREDKVIVVFVVDLSVASATDPVEFVRMELNARAARRGR